MEMEGINLISFGDGQSVEKIQNDILSIIIGLWIRK